MYPPVYVIYTERGAVYGVYSDKDIAIEDARAFTVRDNASYTVQEYVPTLFSLTTVPVSLRNRK